MNVTIPLASGIGTKAKNPGGLGAEPPGTRQPDEPYFFASRRPLRFSIVTW
jgi:hypothetical protein